MIAILVADMSIRYHATVWKQHEMPMLSASQRARLERSERTCPDFYRVQGAPWVTYKRINATAAAATRRSFQGTSHLFAYLLELCKMKVLLAVLLGSMIRASYGHDRIDRLIEKSSSVEWWMFVATAHADMMPECLEQVCAWTHLASISFVDLDFASNNAENKFVHEAANGSIPFRVVQGGTAAGTTSMRQFFKLEHAYHLMQEFEEAVGWRFHH
eukprot:5242536-Amphidinium_carterae.1